MAQSPRLDSILSFSHAQPDQPTNEDHREDAEAASDSGDDDATGTGFEFAFAPPLAAGHSGGGGDLALADDLFAHGRILPAYPVFDRHLLLHNGGDTDMPASASTAPPSPDTYCPWVPLSAPGSPARDPAFPKSASTGEARRWRLRDLVGAGGRSHSDGKEKFVFLQPAAAAPSKMSQGSKTTTTATAEEKQSEKSPPTPQHRQKQGQKKKKAVRPVTEMDMATAHKLFYGKAGTTAGERKQQQASYLPYRPGIVGFFANVHALGRSHHHPY